MPQIYCMTNLVPKCVLDLLSLIHDTMDDDAKTEDLDKVGKNSKMFVLVCG